ncbi:hypothetical protein D3C78_1757840 [compost metagenome]
MSAVITAHHTAVLQYMAFDVFQQLRARQADRQGVRSEVQRVKLNNVVMRTVADWRARPHITAGAFAVGATDTFKG